MAARSRAWVFTLNNPGPEDAGCLNALGYQYCIAGKEVGENGTPHLQGYAYFKNKKSLRQLKKLLPRAHWEIRRGTHEEARTYCMKDGDYHEDGTPPQDPKEQGDKERKRWQRAWELAKEGNIEEVDADIRVRCYSTLKRIRKDYQTVPESIPELHNEWYWGETGAGKTRKAREENPGAYLKNANKWWDGYVDQDVVVIDEWSPEHACLASHLKQWADHHPFAAESKGGMMCIRPKKIIITSNYSPEECFEKAADLEPIRRRFKVTHFTKINQP